MTVPALGFGMSPRGPKIFPKLATWSKLDAFKLNHSELNIETLDKEGN